jgi:hypothetical protein
MIFKETRGFWNFEAEAPDTTLWGTRFGTVYGLAYIYTVHCVKFTFY